MKIIKILLVYLITLSVFAGTVPKEELQSINSYIKLLIHTYGNDNETYTLKVKSANKNNNTELLDQISLTSSSSHWGKLNANLKISRDIIALNSNIFFVDKDGFLTGPNKISTIKESLLFRIKAFNKKGIYKASIQCTSENSHTKIRIVISPISRKAKSIKNLVLGAVIPHKIGSIVTFKLQGKIFPKADLTLITQEAMTLIFNDLADKKEPKISDIRKLEYVFESILKSFL